MMLNIVMLVISILMICFSGLCVFVYADSRKYRWYMNFHLIMMAFFVLDAIIWSYMIARGA